MLILDNQQNHTNQSPTNKPPGQYTVTNLGHCGITAPGYPGTSQYKALMAGTWDIVVLMLGTNDAKQGKNQTKYFPTCTGSWDNKCADPTAKCGCDLANSTYRPSPSSCSSCMYDTAMVNLIKDVQTRGPEPGTPPDIHLMIPVSRAVLCCAVLCCAVRCGYSYPLYRSVTYRNASFTRTRTHRKGTAVARRHLWHVQTSHQRHPPAPGSKDCCVHRH